MTAYLRQVSRRRILIAAKLAQQICGDVAHCGCKIAVMKVERKSLYLVSGIRVDVNDVLSSASENGVSSAKITMMNERQQSILKDSIRRFQEQK